MTRTQRAIFVDFRTEIGRSQKESLSISEHCKKAPHHTKSCFLEPFSSFLHIWSCRGQIRQSQLVPVRRPRLLDRVLVLTHLLNGKSPHHARKEPRRMPYLKQKWKRGIFQPSFSKARCELLQPGQSGVLPGKETEQPCKQEVGSFHEALWQMTPIRAAFICSKACDIIAEDAFSVASQHSSALFLRSAGSASQELKGWYSWISELRLEDLKRVTFYFRTLQENPTSHKTLFSWTVLELLAYLVMLTWSE